MIVGAVGLLLIYVPALFAPGGAAGLMLIAALAIVPVFLIGLGSLVGLWIGSRKAGLVAECALIIAAFGVPFVLVWMATASLAEHYVAGKPLIEKLAAVQALTG